MHNNYLTLMFVATAVLGLCLLSSHGAAQGPPGQLSRTAKVEISHKGADYVVSGERRFELIASSEILVQGKKIALSELPVPCEAEIRYQLRMDKDPQLLSLRVTRLFPASNTTVRSDTGP